MKTKIILGFSFVFIIVSANLYLLFKPQIETGPHGGLVKQAENYKIEKVQTYEKLFAFLLDSNSKTISNKGITGEVRFYFNDQTTSDIPLKPFETDGFTLDMDAGEYYSCRITFNVFGKSISAKFENDNAIVKTKK